MSLAHLLRRRSHPAAGLGAAATCGGAVLQRRVVAHPIAVVRAALAHLGANGAGALVQIGAAQHKVRARLADLGAVEQ